MVVGVAEASADVADCFDCGEVNGGEIRRGGKGLYKYRQRRKGCKTRLVL